MVRPKKGSENHLICEGMANDENRSRTVLTPNGSESGANTLIELVQRLSAIELILGIATSLSGILSLSPDHCFHPPFLPRTSHDSPLV